MTNDAATPNRPRLDAESIFETAERIERTGAEFYEKQAGHSRRSATRDLLRQLAEMERSHERTFREMRRTMLPAEDIATGVGAESYLRAAADSHVFAVYRHADLLTGYENPEEVIRTALAFEKDTVVFFVSMRELVADDKGRAQIARMVREERKHIAMLSAHLQSLQECAEPAGQ